MRINSERSEKNGVYDNKIRRAGIGGYEENVKR